MRGSTFTCASEIFFIPETRKNNKTYHVDWQANKKRAMMSHELRHAEKANQSNKLWTTQNAKKTQTDA